MYQLRDTVSWVRTTYIHRDPQVQGGVRYQVCRTSWHSPSQELFQPGSAFTCWSWIWPSTADSVPQPSHWPCQPQLYFFTIQLARLGDDWESG